VNAATDRRPCPCQVRDAEVPAADFAGWVTRLVHEHRWRLARVARAEGLGAEEAFDAVQEAFASFLVLPRAREIVETPDDARRLLVALTRNIARSGRRLHAHARPHLSDEAALEDLADGEALSDARLEVAEEQARLAGCVRRLADIQRAVVTLRMLDELPGEDVARRLGIQPGHVAVLLHRAKASLHTCMTD
jgi:RNA polymerase sigma-70 factor (ECF subfamily)